jgi:UDP-glucose 4-epimerase
LLNVKSVEIRNIGIRPGEKIHETLLTSEERSLAIEHEKYFQVRKRINLSDSSNARIDHEPEYTSANTQLLNPQELAELLKAIPLVAKSIV